MRRAELAEGRGAAVDTDANPKLGADVARRLGISLGAATVGRFSDGEVNVELLENVRGKDVFVHAATLRRHGIESLMPGQMVKVRIVEGPKGLQVADIRPD